MVNRKSGYLLAKGIQCTKFGKFEAKGSKDIERTSFGLETDRPTNRPANMPSFFEREHKNVF